MLFPVGLRKLLDYFNFYIGFDFVLVFVIDVGHIIISILFHMETLRSWVIIRLFPIFEYFDVISSIDKNALAVCDCVSVLVVKEVRRTF